MKTVGADRAGTWLWFLAAVGTVAVEPYAAALSTVPYSFLDQAVSDLGVTRCGPVPAVAGSVDVCSPAHQVVNVTWFVAGLAIALGALLLRPHWHGSWWCTCLLVVAGLLQVGIGLVPADVDLVVHSVLGLGGLVVQGVTLLVVGAVLRPDRSVLAVSAAVAGVVCLASTALLLAPASWGLPFGLVERLAIYPFLLWLLVAGMRRLTPAGTAERTERR